MRKQKTQTSEFGTKGRINHDSSRFYNSKLYSNFKHNPDEIDGYRENTCRETNKLFLKSSEDMSEIPSRSVHLMVTSPPYNVSKEYDDDLSLDDYLQMLSRVFSETYRVLVVGGRACINIANIGRKPYIPLHSYIIQLMQDIGFLMRGEIIWDKGASASSSTAWGSWMSASNPVLRDIHEYILVFSKGSFSRKKGESGDTIRKEEFLSWTKSLWSFPAVSAKRIGHPAPYPEELPRRLINLYSFKEDIVLDPFVGSGTTCVSAIKSDRLYIGYDTNTSYVELARDRIEEAKLKLF
jgi:modification methylase